MLLFQIIGFIVSVDIEAIIKGEWNAEVFEPEFNGEIKKSRFYHFNLTSEISGKLQADVYTGDFPVKRNETEEENEFIAKFEIEINGEQNGSIVLLEPYNDVLVDYNFIDTFNGYVGAFGIFNESMNYAVNIINIATIHISLYSFDKKIFKEILLTRIQYEKEKHWYDIIVQNSFIIVVFIISYFVFRLSGNLTEKIASRDEKQKKKVK